MPIAVPGCDIRPCFGGAHGMLILNIQFHCIEGANVLSDILVIGVGMPQLLGVLGWR